jgi:uncharacterized protein (DUF1778 family)
MGGAATKSKRVSLRIDADGKRTLERATSYTGSSLTDFVITRALAAANEVIQAREMVMLSGRDWDAFLDALANPPQPSADLERALRRHDELYG